MFRSAFKPGQAIPEDGTYWVNHYAHRVAHKARLRKGEKFPSCKECGERVRFEPAVDQGEADGIEKYSDFREAA